MISSRQLRRLETITKPKGEGNMGNGIDPAAADRAHNGDDGSLVTIQQLAETDARVIAEIASEGNVD